MDLNFIYRARSDGSSAAGSRCSDGQLELQKLERPLKMFKPVERESHVIFHTNSRSRVVRAARPCADRVVDGGDRIKMQAKLPLVQLRCGARGSEIIQPSERGPRIRLD